MLDKIERIERHTKVFMGSAVQSDEQIIKYTLKQLLTAFPDYSKEELEGLINNRATRALKVRALVHLDDLALLGFKEQLNGALANQFEEVAEIELPDGA